MLHGEEAEAAPAGQTKSAAARSPPRQLNKGREDTWSVSSHFWSALVFAGVLLISLIGNAASYFTSRSGDRSQPMSSTRSPRICISPRDGPFGKFDKQQLQRGFQVYSEVCSACHSLKLVSFRDLKELGYNEAEIKAIASDWKTQVPSINPDTGEAATRKALPSDTSRRPSRTKSRRARRTTMRFRPTCR